jgi:hypothetical protein
MRPCALVLALLLALAPAAPAVAQPVAVRFAESVTHGFLVMKDARGEAIAHGQYLQYPKGEQMHNHLVFRFADGSLYDETVTFTQQKVFRLIAYHLVQKGRSFPASSEVAFDRESGRYRARVGDDKADGTLDLPEDLHNGITGLLLKNLPVGGRASGHLMAFTPKPQLLRSTMTREGEDTFFVSDEPHKAARWLVNLEVPGVKGLVASLLGKDPPDSRYWIATGSAPTFLRFEGAMYLKGPRWRVEMSAPRWPDAPSRSGPPGSGRRS